MSSLADRAELTAMIMKLFDHWNLTISEQAAVLGLKSVRTITRYKKGGVFANRPVLMERAKLLLIIHKNLRMHFPSDRKLVYAWVKLQNADFKGKRPLDVMTEELAGLESVRRYLDFQGER